MPLLIATGPEKHATLKKNRQNTMITNLRDTRRDMLRTNYQLKLEEKWCLTHSIKNMGLLMENI